MTICSHCQAELYTETIAGARSVRCAGCNGLNLYEGEKGSGNQNREAWLSLLLGISSFFFSCLTGLPAVFFGIRALRKMRYLPTSGRAKVAAIIGIVTGGFIGTLLIGSIFLVVGAGFGVSRSIEEHENPAVTTKLSKQFSSFDSNVPDLKSRKFFKLPSLVEYAVWTDDQLDVHWLKDGAPRTVYHWQDSNRSVRIVAGKASGWIHPLNIHQVLRDTYLIRRESKKQIGKEKLDWKFLGEDAEVLKVVFQESQSEESQSDKFSDENTSADVDTNNSAENDQPPNSDSEVSPDSEISLLQIDHYSTYVKIDDKYYTMVFVHRPAKSNQSQDDVRRVFESYKMAEPIEE